MHHAPSSLNRFSFPRATRTLLAAAALVTLASCGGGDAGPEAGVAQFASQMRALGAAPAPLNATVAADVAVTSDMVLDWAEYKFPDLFPKAAGVRFPSVVYEGVTYNARAYGGAWGTRYLGITPDGRIFGLGDFTGQGLQQFDTITFWASQVLGDQCAVNPASCAPGTNTPAGALNGCTLPAAQALATGSRLLATYAISIGGTAGQYTIDGLVEGPGTFEGQSAVRTRELINGSQVDEETGQLVTTNLENRSFLQDAGGGFVRQLGGESTITLAGVGSVQGKTVFTPASVNVEYSIQPSQTINKTTTSTTSLTLPVGQPISTTGTSNTVHTFVARESLTVRGRTYATCRYTERAVSGDTGVSTIWYIDGKGVPARVEEVDTFNGVSKTTVIELVNGTLNGAPL
jgi:hypothetical protein